jgi:hypothetical protein
MTHFFQNSFDCVRKPLASVKSPTLLKALRNRGVPEKDNGDTGPTVINEYSLENTSKAD